MRRLCFAAFLALLSAPASAKVLKVEIDGVIDPITAEFIQSAVARATEEEAEFLLIRLATPGGLGISMQEIVQQILNSKTPVVCYVSPKGVHAASAGFFILLAADVAVMSPGTNTGSATPVFPFGMENEVMLEKVKNDALANLRSIVERRERNYELAQAAVEDASSYTEQEALDGGLIDLIAEDQEELMAKLDGFEVRRFNGDIVTLSSASQVIELVEMTFRQRVLATVANPNVALILGMLGLLGLYMEFSNPGLILPGVGGAISLLLALMGFSMLPVNLVGVGLILLALGLIVAEVKVQGFGVLGIGGGVAMLLGLLILIDSPFPELRVNTSLAFGIVIGFTAISIFLLRLIFRAQVSSIVAGNQSLIGVVGVARSGIDANGGKVFVKGEWWDAISADPISSGDKVLVLEAENLLLRVEADR